MCLLVRMRILDIWSLGHSKSWPSCSTPFLLVQWAMGDGQWVTSSSNVVLTNKFRLSFDLQCAVSRLRARVQNVLTQSSLLFSPFSFLRTLHSPLCTVHSVQEQWKRLFMWRVIDIAVVYFLAFLSLLFSSSVSFTRSLTLLSYFYSSLFFFLLSLLSF